MSSQECPAEEAVLSGTDLIVEHVLVLNSQLVSNAQSAGDDHVLRGQHDKVCRC